MRAMPNGVMNAVRAFGIVSVAVLGMSLALAQTASQSAWPNRPIRLILPSAAGGAGDTTSRLVAQKLSERLGQQVVVENRPGAAGVVGSTAIARAEPDGYTIGLLTASTHAASAALNRDLPYDAAADFAPISMIGDLPIVVAGYPGLSAKNLTDLVAAAKAKPNSIANGWAATLPYLAALLFSQRTGIRLNHIPYMGSGQASMDLVEGRIQIQFGTITPILALLRDGKLTPFAVTSAKRTAALPNIPTVAEALLPGFDASLWLAWGAPAGTPASIVRRLNKEIVEIVREKEIRDAFAHHGVDVVSSSPEELGARIRAETVAYRGIAAKTGISPR
jgi:tripartite-type tricarboxylate transporter receptor subunit TctC